MSIEEAIEFACPQCGAPARVSQVQGDRCSTCRFEFKRFGPGEKQMAGDYLHVLTGTKHLLSLPEGRGFIVAHE